MTIQANEIYVRSSAKDAEMVAVADRRITKNGIFKCHAKKLFSVPHLNATIGYFGLASRNEKEMFHSYVPNLINASSGTADISEFAEYVRYHLGRDVSSSYLRKIHSGFHIMGKAPDGVPEFYFVRNFESMNGATYGTKRSEYFISEDFRSRDLIAETSEDSVQNRGVMYVNGEIRSFAPLWRAASAMIRGASTDPLFENPKSMKEAALRKMEIVARYHEDYAESKLVGRPIDSFEL